MWRMWLIFDPRRTLVALFVFLFVLFGAIFFAVDPQVYERGFLLMVPPSKRAAIERA